MYKLYVCSEQFILSLVVLVICFIVGAVCVIIIILATRKMNQTNKKDRVALEETKQSSPERQSTTAPNRRSPQSYAVNYGAESLNSNSNGSSYGATPLLKREDTPVSVGDPPGGATIDFDSPLAKKATKDELSSEKTPLLRRDVSPEPSSVNYSLELPTNSSGLWYRDKSGQHLMRFIVLIIFLLFSSFVVSVVTCIYTLLFEMLVILRLVIDCSLILNYHIQEVMPIHNNMLAP